MVLCACRCSARDWPLMFARTDCHLDGANVQSFGVVVCSLTAHTGRRRHCGLVRRSWFSIIKLATTGSGYFNQILHYGLNPWLAAPQNCFSWAPLGAVSSLVVLGGGGWCSRMAGVAVHTPAKSPCPNSASCANGAGLIRGTLGWGNWLVQSQPS